MKSRFSSFTVAFLCAIACAALATTSCGGGGASAAPPSPPTIASIALSPSPATIVETQTQQFTATAKDSSGNTISGITFTWSSDDTNVATVSNTGMATGVAVGSAHISASSGGVTGTAALTVNTNIQTVTVTPSSASITVGQTQQFSATAADASGNALSGKVFTWASSNTSVATVDSTGKATGVAAGTATISAASEGVTGTATLTVTAASSVAVTISPTSATVQTGATQQFTATVTGSSNTAVTWSVNSTPGGNSTVGTISTSGLYTAPGTVPSLSTVTITATSAADTTQSASATVSITAPPASGTVTVMASGLNSPGNIVTDSANVYWVDDSDGSVGAVPISSVVQYPTTPQILSGPPGNGLSGYDIAQDTANIYFTLLLNGGGYSVNEVAKAGGGATDLADSSNTSIPGCTGLLCGIAPDSILAGDVGLNVLVFDNGGQIIGRDGFGNLTLLTTDGSSPNPQVRPGGLAWALATNGTDLFFDIIGGPNSGSTSIFEMPVGGGLPPTALYAVNGIVSILAPNSGACAQSVFWIDTTDDILWQLLPGENTPYELGSNLFASGGTRLLAADSTNIYFPQNNQIATVACVTSPPPAQHVLPNPVTVLTSVGDAAGIAGIAVDSTNVYWSAVGTGPGNGSIRKVAK